MQPGALKQCFDTSLSTGISQAYSETIRWSFLQKIINGPNAARIYPPAREYTMTFGSFYDFSPVKIAFSQK